MTPNRDYHDIDIALAPPLSPTAEQRRDALASVQHTLIQLEREANDTTCDFCNSRNAVWSYPTNGVQLVGGGIQYLDNTPWSACSVCSEMIEGSRITTLIERMIDSIPPGHILRTAPRAFLTRGKQAFFKVFREARTGARVAR